MSLSSKACGLAHHGYEADGEFALELGDLFESDWLFRGKLEFEERVVFQYALDFGKKVFGDAFFADLEIDRASLCQGLESSPFFSESMVGILGSVFLFEEIEYGRAVHGAWNLVVFVENLAVLGQEEGPTLGGDSAVKRGELSPLRSGRCFRPCRRERQRLCRLPSGSANR